MLKKTTFILSLLFLFACQSEPTTNTPTETPVDTTTQQSTTISNENARVEEELEERETQRVYQYSNHPTPDFEAYGFCPNPGPPPCYLPSFQPIGWSEDGMFAYKLLPASYGYDDEEIIIMDVRKNQIVERINCSVGSGDKENGIVAEEIAEFPDVIYRDSSNQRLLEILDGYGMKFRNRDDTMYYIHTVHVPLAKLGGDIYEFTMENDLGDAGYFGIMKECKEARLVATKLAKNRQKTVKKYVLGSDKDVDIENGDLYTGGRHYVGYIQDPFQDRIIIMYFHETVIFEGDDFAYVLNLMPFEGF